MGLCKHMLIFCVPEREFNIFISTFSGGVSMYSALSLTNQRRFFLINPSAGTMCALIRNIACLFVFFNSLQYIIILQLLFQSIDSKNLPVNNQVDIEMPVPVFPNHPVKKIY